VCSDLAAPVALPNREVIGRLFFGHSDPGVSTKRSERPLVAVAAQALS
jgi:hypothetical protein